MNQEYIAKELCENKDVPKMNCKGKCYLAKQFKKQENKEKEERTPSKQRLKSDVFYCQNRPLSKWFYNFDLKENSSCLNLDSKLRKGYLNEIFQPPQLG